VAIAALVAACGGDDSDATPTPGPTATPFVSSDPALAEALCELIPNDEAQAITGYAVIEKVPYSAVNTTACTLTFNVLGCGEECVISVNDLGVPNDEAETSSAEFRRTWEEVHAASSPTVEEEPLGPESWLGVTHANYPGYELLYFIGAGHAYAVSGPLRNEDAFPESDIVEISQVIAANLGAAP
jgi:hypothetical protein